MLYLYIKTHNKTGMKYLGQTKRDPKKYPGSGTDWKTHIREHGNDVTTEILGQYSNKEERNYWGRYYSTFYNIVNSVDNFGNKIWANRIPETGGGCAAGEANRHYDPKHYYFVNVDGRTENCTKATFKQKYKIELPSMSFMKKGHSIQGWYVDQLPEPEIITLYHSDQKTVFIGTRDEFQKSYRANGGHLSQVLNSQVKSILGWYLNKEDITSIRLFNKNGTEFVGTRAEFKKKYPEVNNSHLTNLLKGKKKTHRGWSIIEEIK